MRVAVKIIEMTAITIPIVASLAVRMRKTNRFCPRYFLTGRLSKKAGTPEAKLMKKPNRKKITHTAPIKPMGRLYAMSNNVPTTPKITDTVKIRRRFLLV